MTKSETLQTQRTKVQARYEDYLAKAKNEETKLKELIPKSFWLNMKSVQTI